LVILPPAFSLTFKLIPTLGKIMATFHHLVSGSSFIMPKGKVLRFMGKPAGVGIYETTDEEEIAELRALCKSPTAQCVEATETASAETLDTAVFSKPIDPAIQQSKQDAAENTARTSVPEVAAAQDNLAKVIAAAKSK
jgi:hypothetical protein